MSLVRRWQTETGDTYVVGLVRMLLGIMLLVSAFRAVLEFRSAPYFADVFHLPLLAEPLIASREVYAALLVVQFALAFAVAFGVWARGALFASAVLGLYLLLCDRL